MALMARVLTKEEETATINSNIFKTFVRNTLDNPDPEPFCPFIFSGYCDDAYSKACYTCEHAVKDYLRIEDTLQLCKFS